MRDTSITWVVALDGTQIVAVQHGCADGMPVNGYLDEHNNWMCPNCGATYSAAVPLEGWSAFGLKTDEPSSAPTTGDAQESLRSGGFYSMRVDGGEAVEHHHIGQSMQRCVPCVWEMDPHIAPPRYHWRCPECDETTERPFPTMVMP
jgi:predicted RNA-binding Zn-ribbon protein involved in translation (DUF1610 family)